MQRVVLVDDFITLKKKTENNEIKAVSTVQSTRNVHVFDTMRNVWFMLICGGYRGGGQNGHASAVEISIAFAPLRIKMGFQARSVQDRHADFNTITS